jgi:hypothetical protein
MNFHVEFQTLKRLFKGGLIAERIHFGSNLQKWVPNQGLQNSPKIPNIWISGFFRMFWNCVQGQLYSSP